MCAGPRPSGGEDSRDALAHVSKAQQPKVASYIRIAFAQDSAAGAHQCWREVADSLRERLPKLAALMDDAELGAYETPSQLRAGLTRYFRLYKARRRHSALDRHIADAVYFKQTASTLAA